MHFVPSLCISPGRERGRGMKVNNSFYRLVRVWDSALVKVFVWFVCNLFSFLFALVLGGIEERNEGW